MLRNGTAHSQCKDVVVTHNLKTDHVIEGCEGLKALPHAKNAVQCESYCTKHVECSVWQWSEACFVGEGLAQDCGARMQLEGSVGQRIQHGTVKVIRENTGVQTLGLAHYGLAAKNGTDDTAFLVKRCAQICKSNFLCKVWQYGEDGCWIENPPNNIGTKRINSSRWAQTMIAGQSIEHMCTGTTSSLAAEDSFSFPWVWLIAVGAAVLIGLLVSCILLILAIKYAPTPRMDKNKGGMSAHQDAKPFLESRGTSRSDLHPLVRK